MTGDVLSTWAQVRERLDARGRGARYQLAQHISQTTSSNMSPSYLSRRLQKDGPLTVELAAAISAFLQTTPGLAEEAAEFHPAPAAGSRRGLPVYGARNTASAEDGIDLRKPSETMFLPEGLELGPGDYFAVKPYASLMEPRIFPGEVLVVMRDFSPAYNRDVLVEFSDGTGVVRTFKGQHSGKVFVEAYQPTARQEAYDATRVRGLHGVAFKP